MACSDGNRGRRSGFTIAYRISRMPGVIHWWIWSGPVMAYQLLPRFRVCISHGFGGFGLVGCGITILYRAANLGLIRPRGGFTNHYLRGEGRGMTEYYVGLELIMCGAVDEGDVVLVFIGQHTGTGCEVLGRLAWHFDRVGDFGTLATGLH